MLIKLYEASAPTVPDGQSEFSIITAGWYCRRYDCAIHFGVNHLASVYKVFRDGSLVRMGAGSFNHVYGFSIDDDLPISIPVPGTPLLNDPIGMQGDPAKLASLTYTGVVAAGHTRPLVYNGFYYIGASTANVTKHNLGTGALVETIVTTGSITPFAVDRLDITRDGILVAIDADNGTYGVVRFFDLNTGENLYTSTFARSRAVYVDRVHKNIWSVRLSDSIMEVYSFDVAPSVFNPLTMGANKSRYREDALSGTLLGAQGEPIRYWPVGWRLTQPRQGGGFLGDFEVGYGALGSHGSLGPSAEGHLEVGYTETDANGVTTNRYCGPGSIDYVGQSATIEAWTGY